MPNPGRPEQAFADLIRRKATQVETSKALQSNSTEERFAARVVALTRDGRSRTAATAIGAVTEQPKLASRVRGRRKPV
jgi:hypothetical protein